MEKRREDQAKAGVASAGSDGAKPARKVAHRVKTNKTRPVPFGIPQEIFRASGRVGTAPSFDLHIPLPGTVN